VERLYLEREVQILGR